MESRRVQKVGYSSLAVTLPRDWTEEVKLARGDIVLFSREDDGSLRIIPASIIKEEKEINEVLINTNLCSDPKMLERLIVGNYILSRDTIRIVGDPRIPGDHVNRAREISRKLIGLSLIEETPNQIILQCSVDPTKFPVNILLRRLYIIASLMLREALEALDREDLNLAHEAIRREEDADMVYWLTLRLLLTSQVNKVIADKMGLKDPLRIMGMRIIARFVEAMADCGEAIALNVVKLKEVEGELKRSLVDGLLKIGRATYDLCYKAMEAFFTNNVKLANEAIDSFENRIEAEAEQLAGEILEAAIKKHTAVFMMDILGNLRRIGRLGKEIAEIAINQFLIKSSEICQTFGTSKV
ncbi:MAG: phosphate uptake regulator PhoU [Candidatus Nezhaarchaeales archaeon]